MLRLDMHNWAWNVRGAVKAKLIPFVGHTELKLVDQVVSVLLDADVPIDRLPPHVQGWRRVNTDIAPITRVGVFEGQFVKYNSQPPPIMSNTAHNPANRSIPIYTIHHISTNLHQRHSSLLQSTAKGSTDACRTSHCNQSGIRSFSTLRRWPRRITLQSTERQAFELQLRASAT